VPQNGQRTYPRSALKNLSHLGRDLLYISENGEQTKDSARLSRRRMWENASVSQQIRFLQLPSNDGANMMPTVDVADLIAALVLDRRHRCSPLCLCDRVREIPSIAEAIARLEDELQTIASQRANSPSSDVNPYTPLRWGTRPENSEATFPGKP
jgi:hypothetical protein